MKILPPNDVILQKSRRSKQFVVHRDKLKLFHGDAPTSWLKSDPSGVMNENPESPIAANNSCGGGLAGQLIVTPGDVKDGVDNGVDDQRLNIPVFSCPVDGVAVTETVLHEEPGHQSEDEIEPSTVEQLSKEDRAQHCEDGVTSQQMATPVHVPALPPPHQNLGDIMNGSRPRRLKCTPKYLNDYVYHNCRVTMTELEKKSQVCRCPAEDCDRVFSNRGNLNRHLKKYHSGPQPDPGELSGDDPDAILIATELVRSEDRGRSSVEDGDRQCCR